MKVAAVVCSSFLFFVTALVPTPTLAQNPIPFQHIVLIVQENRTPDNLFGSSPSTAHCGAAYPFETGVDIQDGGPDANPPFNGNNRCLMSQHLNTCWDIAHWHTTWNTQAHIDGTANPPYAKMDGACGNNVFPEGQACAAPNDCPPYSFVQKSDVQQYFDIATNYGFANYMFQTNEGPSFEAHQFLLGGTSAPTYPLDSNNYYLRFVSELGQRSCGATTGDNPSWADFYGQDAMALPSPYSDSSNWHDCYDHDTLVDRLMGAGKSWRYYSPSPSGGLWTAVNAIHHLCFQNPNTQPGSHDCDTPLWSQNMKFETQSNAAPIFTDITGCQLQQVSWVIPDARWSDHASDDLGLGPSYVADIVDAIGNSGCTDTIGSNTYTYWQDTAIFIVWDDWGGWYDHVAPPPSLLLRQYPGVNNSCSNPTNTWGCGYTYGFRVPLLVVSAYTPAGYVSGNTTLQGGGFKQPYIHDFGSILRFIENNFGLSYINTTSILGYADRDAPDNVAPFLPLADFFTSSYRSFTPVQPSVGLNANYFINYFQQQGNQGQSPEGPDGDDAD